jgi:hypothetical protein
MPTDTERSLLALLEQHRQETNTPVAAPPSQLPELTPQVLLGAGALLEFEAAQQIQPGTPVTPDGSPHRVRAAQQGEPVVGLAHSMGRRVVEGRDVQTVVTSEPSVQELSQLFMNSEAEAAFQLSGGDHTVAAEDAFSVEFDSEFGGEGTTTPNPAARFQVGRESPPPINFNRAPMSGPSDGVVVATRGSDGSFRQVPHNAPQRPSYGSFRDGAPGSVARSLRDHVTHVEAQRDPMMGPSSRQPTSHRTVAAPNPNRHVYRPTAWERLISDD